MQQVGTDQVIARGERVAYADRLDVIHVLAPGEFGGLEAVVQRLATGHAHRGHRVHVVVVLERGGAYHPLLETLRAGGVSVIPSALPRRAYLREAAGFRAICRRIGPDVVHTHGYRAGVVDATVAQRLGLPTVTTIHGFTGGDLKNRLYEHLQRRTLRRFDAVVAVSRPLFESLSASGVEPGRLHLFPNAWVEGAELLSRREARRALGIADNHFHIGWVGRVTLEKGPDIWLATLARIGDLQFTASIIGDGRERSRLQPRTSELGLVECVKWHGAVRDAARLYRAFDLFVLSSRTEGVPMVLFEAMAAGVPIIATRVGGVPDVVTPVEALLVPPDDPAALAEAVRSVYRDRQSAAARARAAQKRLSTRFSLQPWLDAHESLYRRLAGRARTSR